MFEILGNLPYLMHFPVLNNIFKYSPYHHPLTFCILNKKFSNDLFKFRHFMQIQNLFSQKNKKNIMRLSSADLIQTCGKGLRKFVEKKTTKNKKNLQNQDFVHTIHQHILEWISGESHLLFPFPENKKRQVF